jgi:MoaA/NifB/PqqE/SkfB family radical SAM enzyme
MLDDIGFYTLTERRAKNGRQDSRLMRAELLLSARCNFHCPYCRGVGGPDMGFEQATALLQDWIDDDLFAVRLSGGEPLLYKRLPELVRQARDGGITWRAVSTNGSAPLRKYLELLDAGVNDFSISLDACCAADGDRMAGIRGLWGRVVQNIRDLSARTYVTVGVVLTEENGAKVSDIIDFAAGLGVSDIRVIPAAQHGAMLPKVEAAPELLARLPLLRYRLDNLSHGRTVRGLVETDSRRCGLAMDDLAVCESKHYPCIIYLREGGEPIGDVAGPVRRERADWSRMHDTHADPICSKNCLDVCVAFNNARASYNLVNPTTPDSK